MKKLLLGTSVAIFAAMTLTASIAYARGHGQAGECRPEMTFEMLDTDGSGSITAAELEAKALEKFAEQDANADGFLDRDEILAARQARMDARGAEHEAGEGSEMRDRQRGEMGALMITQLIERRDADGDGMLSLDEMKPQDAMARFEQADEDGNGEISQAEFDAAKAGRGEHGFGKKGPRSRGGCDNG